MQGASINPNLEELRNSILSSGNYKYRSKSGRVAKTLEHAVAVEAFKLKLNESYSCDAPPTFLSGNTLKYLSRFSDKEGFIRKYRTLYNREENKFTIIRVV